MTPRPRSLAAASAALVAGCLVLLNLLAQRLPLRADLSQGSLYSLSPGSVRVLRGLKDPVEVRVYFSDELPPEYAAARSYVKDLLDEYRRASRGLLRVRFLDVDKDPEAQKEALSAGVEPVQFNVVSQEEYKVRQGFMGLVLRHETRKEVIPVVLRAGGLEYELTSRLVRLSGKPLPVIGFVSSDGALAEAALPQPVQDALEKRYRVVPVDLGALPPGSTVPADVSALVMLGATQKLPAQALYALDQFLMSGRPLLLAADARRTDLRSFMASPNPSGLPDLLRRYGVGVGSSFVLDEQNTPVQVTQQRGFFQLTNIVPYPVFPVATDLDKDNPTTRDLDSLPLPFAAPLTLSTAAAHGPWRALARSSPRSWLRG
ncbi:MAG: GldG family protein, partial [Elusimicrobia bacterium]|nr:GldG family protein [Elusimicrobiota bacterium]